MQSRRSQFFGSALSLPPFSLASSLRYHSSSPWPPLHFDSPILRLPSPSFRFHILFLKKVSLWLKGWEFSGLLFCGQKCPKKFEVDQTYFPAVKMFLRRNISFHTSNKILQFAFFRLQLFRLIVFSIVLLSGAPQQEEKASGTFGKIFLSSSAYWLIGPNCRRKFKLARGYNIGDVPDTTTLYPSKLPFGPQLL